MSKQIKLMQDYYNEGISLYKKKTITLSPGVTVLVGCNGIGKTTLLRQIKDQCKKEHTPIISFDNLKDGGGNAITEASFYGRMNEMATMLCSSEGENIRNNLIDLASRLGSFIKEGIDPKDSPHLRIKKCLDQIEKKEEVIQEIPKERWILLDAIDSGLSVDNIIDLKEQLFSTILEYNNGNDIYIIVSANEYEMARKEKCFDVYHGKYIKFTDYEAYRTFILESKEWKKQRI